MTREEKDNVCKYMQKIWNERCAFKGLFDVTNLEMQLANYGHMVQECFGVEIKVVDDKVVIE